ncbi:MAG TPA: hypothetical protein VJ723_10160, partial [Candidatus Angelobacter sp.]|nr:hypothetical protein [Candidatus Angelobacter sp.]
MPENRSVNARLDSWKDIATYLDRDIRTAMRWEKNGLPVHRVPGGQRQAVFAYTDEIDSWLVSQDKESLDSNSHGSTSDRIEEPEETRAESLADISLTEPEAGKPAVHLVRPRKWLLVLSGSVLLGIVGILVARWHKPSAMQPPELQQLTADGHAKGNILRTDGTTLYFTESEGTRGILVSAQVGGGSVRPVETHFANVALQDLSRDGKTLLITSPEGTAREGPLWTVPVQGGTASRVGDGLCGLARWSPDNRRIACASWTKITVMDADGSHSHPLGAFAFQVLRLAWMPNGQALRFVLSDASAFTFAAWEIAVSKDGATGQPQRLPLVAGCCTDWTWIQNGKTFVYVQLDSSGNSHLFMSPENGLSTGLTKTELLVKTGPLVLAANQGSGQLYLVFGSAYSGGLWRVDARKGALQPFLPGLSAEYVAFSRDGQWITFVDTLDESLWRSRVDGSEPLQLTKPPMKVVVSSWSPDGKRIAFMGKEPN